jgi:hypothetical protein
MYERSITARSQEATEALQVRRSVPLHFSSQDEPCLFSGRPRKDIRYGSFAPHGRKMEKHQVEEATP